MSASSFPFTFALRESRAPRRLVLLMASVTAGVAALVAIGSFTRSLQVSVRDQARALLGADLALGSATPFSARAESLMGGIVAAVVTSGPSARSSARPARMTRSTILEALFDDYVRTARSKGLREQAVVGRHVMRNALLPVVTTSGAAMGALFGGAVATETAFGVPGLGSYLVQALNSRDWMVIQNLVLIYGTIAVIINILVDLSYAWIDPRIRYG